MSVERFRARQSFLRPTERPSRPRFTPIFAAIVVPPTETPPVTYFPSRRATLPRASRAIFARKWPRLLSTAVHPFSAPTCRINTLSRTTRYSNIPGNTIKPIHGACIFSPLLFFLSFSLLFFFFYNDTWKQTTFRFVSFRIFESSSFDCRSNCSFLLSLEGRSLMCFFLFLSLFFFCFSFEDVSSFLQRFPRTICIRGDETCRVLSPPLAAPATWIPSLKLEIFFPTGERNVGGD